jgi:dTMP kinase
MAKGRVIAFEGVDGAGKSTVIQRVAEELRQRGETIFMPRTGKEHDSRPTRMIRRLTRDPRNLDLCPRAEFALYCARETQIIEECVKPAVARGETVLLDRSMLTPVVLGSFGRGLPLGECETMAQIATAGVTPDVTMVFDVHPRTSRIRKRVEKIRTRPVGGSGRKGLGGSALKERVRSGYGAMAEKYGFPLFHVERISPATLAERVLKVLNEGARPEQLEDDMDHVPAWVVDPEADLLDALWKQRSEVALFLSNGLILGRPLREKYFEADPALAAFAMDVEDPLRERAAEVEPEYALRGFSRKPISGDDDLRLRFLSRTPGPAIRALKHLLDPRVDAILREYAEQEPGAVAANLTGRDDEDAFAIRKLVWKQAELEDKVDSLLYCKSDRAWKLREKLLEENPAEAVAGLRGLTCDRTHALLERYADNAPKAVLRAIGGREDARAHAFRLRLMATGREVMDSLRGLSDEGSWQIRETKWREWPSTVIHSLMGIHETPRAKHMIAQCLEAAGGDLHAKRRLQGLEERHLRPAWAQIRSTESALDE